MLVAHEKVANLCPKPSNSQVNPNINQCKCRTCGETFPNRKMLYNHRITSHQLGGAAPLQNEPWGAEENPPWQNDENDEEDIPLREEYTKHRAIILKGHNETGNLDKIYNYPIDHTRGLERQIIDNIGIIYERGLESHQQVFRINFSLGLILKNIETNEFRYFKPYLGVEQVLPSTYPITNRRSIGYLSNKITRLDLNATALRQRPNTKWRPVLVTNVLYKVALLDFPLGSQQISLPQQIKDSKSIIGLENNRNTGNKYEPHY